MNITRIIVTAVVAAGFIGMSTNTADAKEIDTTPCGGSYVEATPRPGNTAPVATVDAVNVVGGDIVTLDVLGNDIDAEGDALSTVVVTCAGYSTWVNSDNTVGYQVPINEVKGETFSYGMTDGDYYRTADVVATVTPLHAPRPKVLKHRHGRAKLRFHNPSPRSFVAMGGSFNNVEPDFVLWFKSGEDATKWTKRSKLDFVIAARNNVGYVNVVKVGTMLTTKRGVLRSSSTLNRSAVPAGWLS
jgi:hypothetical protein